MTDSATLDSNVRHRTAQLAKAFGEYDRLQQEKEDLAAAQGDIKKRIKDDLDISPAAFAAAYRLWRMEAVKRDSLLDQMRECFSALGIGEQSDFLAVIEQAGARVVPRPDAFGDAPGG